MAKPLLKWAGGKRKLLPQIRSILENNNRIDFEKAKLFDVFGGGASVAIGLSDMFNEIILNDTNDELINLYTTVTVKFEELIYKLLEHEQKNEKNYFYNVRKQDRSDDFKLISDSDKAARTVYLNRVCYNGLYRLNSKGYFNVPYGKYKNPLICDVDNIRELNQLFNYNFQFQNCDFQTLIEDVRKGDVVYFDPPYDQEVPQSFVSYTSDGFNRKDQQRLKHCVDILTERGAYVILSNSATKYILELYKDYIDENSIIDVGRSIGAAVESRIKVREILIDNFRMVNYENRS